MTAPLFRTVPRLLERGQLHNLDGRTVTSA